MQPASKELTSHRDFKHRWTPGETTARTQNKQRLEATTALTGQTKNKPGGCRTLSRCVTRRAGTAPGKVTGPWNLAADQLQPGSVFGLQASGPVRVGTPRSQPGSVFGLQALAEVAAAAIRQTAKPAAISLNFMVVSPVLDISEAVRG